MSIGSPIEQRNTGKGSPNAVLHFDRPLNNRQQHILDMLPEFNSRVAISKKDISLRDIAALTAKTGDEFALFSRKGERVVVRGSSTITQIDETTAQSMAREGWKWSGHTHPGSDVFCLFASEGDKAILKAFGQKQSCILNSVGRWTLFDAEE